MSTLTPPGSPAVVHPPASTAAAVRRRQAFVTVVEHDGDHAVVSLRGEYDLASVPELTEVLAAAMTLDDVDLVVDLEQVRFMDASTLGVFVRTEGLLREQSRSLGLRSPSSLARRILGVCDLLDLVAPPLSG